MSISTEDQIREALKFYSDGMGTADTETLQKAFHQQAILCGYLGDELIAAPIQALYDWVGSNPAPAGYECSILDIDITNRAAAAKVREKDAHGVFVDYFHLLNVDDRWWIVSKVWDGESTHP
jgi:Putative lumazine-binding